MSSLRRRCAAAALALLVVLPTHAYESPLPDLGDTSSEGLSASDERQIGASVMRELRRSGMLLDDPELTAYVNQLGGRLVDASEDARASFTFLPLRDPSVNAFAVPGGVIAVHSGLIVMAQHESELASVLAHEIAHVTQHHIARMIESQRVTPWMTLAALGLAILAAHAGHGDMAAAAAAAGPAMAIQRQLDFTYGFEQEADRIGMQTLTRAGFDPSAMPVFFDRLQKHNRLVENNAPEFLRTHPVTYKRIADAQARLKDMPYRQVPDSQDFLFMREKARVLQGDQRTMLDFYAKTLSEGRFANRAAHLYGYALAQLRNRDFAGAQKSLDGARTAYGRAHPALEYLQGQLLLAQGRPVEAAAQLKQAAQRFPGSRALVYGEIDARLAAGQLNDALALTHDAQELYPSDAELYQREAKAYQGLGNAQRQHAAQAEYYVRLLEYTAAIEQLQIAQRQPGDDFYLLSRIEARLRELQQDDESQRRKAGKPSSLDSSQALPAQPQPPVEVGAPTNARSTSRYRSGSGGMPWR
ncbi:M48 family metalloprotease [Chitiniphilus eburneus]|uniref:M48 family metallopeptidase n=1 Tax=Chitiniphilus eburneus TaxID=2571148 RepID=A0A4U0Q3I8_9NEIS|nr:M48 family metalloprotease [Chitiniphilus eburneus]TJZ75661.1 M48 family metallopeptidase [Chitiniphilus eburneus]